MAEWLEAGMNIPGFISLLPILHPGLPLRPKEITVRARIGVARDAAFCFYYADNLRLLQESGAELCYFSPLTDVHLPDDLDGLYIGGGYPELYAQALADNATMRMDVRQFSAMGKPVYAECGGFMYLMHEIRNHEGDFLPMCGCFAMQCHMDRRFRALGYREITTMAPSLLGAPWTVARGHEFHYSYIAEPDPAALAVYKLRDRKDWRPESEGFMHKNTLGSYVHLHFASNPAVARAFVDVCEQVRIQGYQL